jgi:hypothetical protein
MLRLRSSSLRFGDIRFMQSEDLLHDFIYFQAVSRITVIFNPRHGGSHDREDFLQMSSLRTRIADQPPELIESAAKLLRRL